MRAFVVLALVSCAFAAPTNNRLRTKKSPSISSYGCGGGQAVAPVALYLSPGIGQHYREDEAELAQREVAMMEQQHQHPHHHHHLHHGHPTEHEIPEHARSYYEPAAAASIGGLSASIGPGPILGPSGPILAPAGHILASSADLHSSSAVFPGSKVSNCAVPLLLSCSPTVTSGHLAHEYAAPAYRAQDQEFKREVNEKSTSEPAFHISQSQQPQAKSWMGNEQAPVKAVAHEHGFKREVIEEAASEQAGQISSLSSQQHKSLDSERVSVGEAKWSQAKDEQIKPWSLERAAPLDLQLNHKQVNLQVPKSINEANVADNLNV